MVPLREPGRPQLAGRGFDATTDIPAGDLVERDGFPAWPAARAAATSSSG